jgi:arylsulfatase A-like enzyme
MGREQGKGGCTDGPWASSTGRPPHLVYVLADQLRYASCGYAGDERAHTPHIDALSRKGVSFRHAVSGHPVCAPYRASTASLLATYVER